MRQAFLILAHKNIVQLNKLIEQIDNDRTDIIIHIDSKTPKFEVTNVSKSRVFMIPSMRTNWGGYSLVECELRLIEKALKINDYSFIHLLSGQDLLIKPIDHILSFFDEHIDYNFVHFDKPEDSLKRNERIKYYYLFQEYKNRSRKTIWSVLDRGIIEIQKRIGIDRRRHFQGEFKAGSQWWSIKQDLAEYIVSKRDYIKKHFMFTMSDEMFVQTLVYNSPFYDTLFMGELNDQHANQRLIDFERGHPYLWTIKDVEEIMRSDLLFARKFDEVIDSEVIDVITKFCTNIV